MVCAEGARSVAYGFRKRLGNGCFRLAARIQVGVRTWWAVPTVRQLRTGRDGDGARRGCGSVVGGHFGG